MRGEPSTVFEHHEMFFNFPFFKLIKLMKLMKIKTFK